MENNIIDGIKIGAGLFAAYGTEEIVRDIANKVMPETVSAFGKAGRIFGAVIVGGALGKLSSKIFESAVDDTIEWANEYKKQLAKAKKKAERQEKIEEVKETVKDAAEKIFTPDVE